MLKNLLQFVLAVWLTLAGTSVSAFAAQKVSRVYGVQIYSEDETASSQKLVSFSLDKPSSLSVEANLDGYQIMAAACDGDTYYMLHSDDGIAPAKFVTYSMVTRRFHEVKAYDFDKDLAGALIVTDMTYDPADGCIYLVGANLYKAEIVGGQLNAPFGLYRMDPATGAATSIGDQETALLVALAAGGGELWGVDTDGNVWIVNKNNGRLDDIVTSTGVPASGTQSMSYDFGNNVFYWASYTESNGAGKSDLISFALDTNGELEVGQLGSIGRQAELIGLYIEPDPLDRNSPAGVTDLTVTPAPQGKREATLSWVNPTTTLDGASLSGTLNSIVYRNGIRLVSLSGAPGKQMEWTDKNISADTMYTYSVAIEYGNLTGHAVYTDPIFVGTDIPGAPATVAARRNGSGYAITIDWTAPTLGAFGGWYNPSGLRYRVTRFPDNKVVAESLNALSFTDSDITVQEGYTYGVAAIAADGAVGPEAVSNVVISGPALTVPYVMTLTPEDENLWTVADSDGDGYRWYVYRTGWAGTFDPFFRYSPEETLDPAAEANDWILSPSIALEAGKTYTVAYDIRLLGDLFPGNTSLWIGNGDTPEAMTRKLVDYEGEINDIEWVNHTIPFTVDADGVYNFGFKISNRTPVQFYHFAVREPQKYDMKALKLEGPSSSSAGIELTYYVTVENTGYETVKSYTVTLTDADGTKLSQATSEKNLAPGYTDVLALKWTPSKGGDYTLYATATTEGDVNNPAEDIAVLEGVHIMDAGTWYTYDDGDQSSGVVPFFTNHLYSATQSIYTADMIGRKTPGRIQALTYHIASLFGDRNAEFEAEIWIGHTPMSFYPDSDPLPEAEMTKVFEGPLTVSPLEKTLTIPFDRTFDYTGGNIAVYARYHTERRAALVFEAFYAKQSVFHSLVAYSDEHPVGLSETMDLYVDLPHISLFFDDPGEIVNVSADKTQAAASYDRTSRKLTVAGDFEYCRVYNAMGVLIATFTPGDDMTLTAAEGVGIVEVIGSAGRSVSKIVF